MTSQTTGRSSSSKPFINQALILMIAATVAGVTTFALWQFQSSQSNTSQKTQPTTTVRTVTALGRLEPKGEVIKLSASTSSQESRIEQLLVQENDVLKAGQVIAILDSRDRLQDSLNQAQEDVRVAEAELAQTSSGAKQGEIAAQRATIRRLQAERQGNIDEQTATVKRLESELKNAATEFQRYESLYRVGATSASQRDSKLLTRDTARQSLQEAQAKLQRTLSTNTQELDAARANLDRIAEVRPVDVAVAKAKLSRAIAARNQAQSTLEEAYVRSPQDGTVLKIHNRAGEVISTDTGIADIGQTSQMYALAEVYQSDISKVKVGQKARVTSESLLGKELIGTVEKINSQVERQETINADPSDNIDSRIVEVKIRLDQQSSQKVTKLTNLQVKVVIEL